MIAATAVASLAFLAPVVGAPAFADSVPENGAKAVAKSGQSGDRVRVTHGNRVKNLGTTVFNITVDGKEYKSYCIELDKPFAEGNGSVQAWEDLDEVSKNKVGWILENSYPKVNVTELAKNSGVEGLTYRQAISATQAAVWHFTTKGGSDLVADSSKWTNSQADKIIKLYKYLIGDANVGVNFSDNHADVDVSLEGGKTYKAGDKVGPIKVSSSQKTVKLQAEPQGDAYVIVDSEGNQVDLDAVKPGELFVQINKDAPKGSLTLTATSAASSLTGRVFVHDIQNKQRVVLIDTKKDVKQAKVNFEWGQDETPPPCDNETPPCEETTPPGDQETPPGDNDTPKPGDNDTPKPGDNDTPKPGDNESDDNGSSDLPRTGAEFAGALVAAIVLIVGGVAALFVARRKQNN